MLAELLTVLKYQSASHAGHEQKTFHASNNSQSQLWIPRELVVNFSLSPMHVIRDKSPIVGSGEKLPDLPRISQILC